MKNFNVIDQSIVLGKSLFRRGGFWIWVLSVVLLNTCTDIPPKPTVEVSSVLLKEVISRKWKGVITIPSPYDIPLFADSGVRRTNCFEFEDVSGTNVTTYEWKSDVYSNNNDPQQAWFLATPNKTNEMELSPVIALTDAFFYFILRYNVTNDHLSNQYVARENGKPYSVQQALGTIATNKVGGTPGHPSFKDRAIYMPVFLRNININKEGKSTLELNFAFNFEAKPVEEDPDWDSIYRDLETFIESNYGFIKSYWVSYEEVDNIEDGAGGCPDF